MHDLSGFPARVHDINDRGEITGTTVGTPDQWYSERAFLWSGGQWHALRRGEAGDVNERGEVAVTWCSGRLCEASVTSLTGSRLLKTDRPWPFPMATALNDRGDVIGRIDWTGVRWVGETITYLGFEPVAINERGQIVGHPPRTDETPPNHALLWTDGRTQDLGTLGGTNSSAVDLNDRGQVAGNSELPDGTTHAFLWSRGRMHDLGTLGGRSSTATAVNQRGHVIGVSETADGERHGFLWRRGRMHDLGTLGGAASAPTDLDDRGRVVGWSETADGFRRAFLWRHGRMHDLGTLGGDNSTAVAMNRRGEVIGMADHADGDEHAFLWSTRSPK